MQRILQYRVGAVVNLIECQIDRIVWHHAATLGQTLAACGVVNDLYERYPPLEPRFGQTYVGEFVCRHEVVCRAGFAADDYPSAVADDLGGKYRRCRARHGVCQHIYASLVVYDGIYRYAVGVRIVPIAVEPLFGHVFWKYVYRIGIVQAAVAKRREIAAPLYLHYVAAGATRLVASSSSASATCTALSTMPPPLLRRSIIMAGTSATESMNDIMSSVSTLLSENVDMPM